MTESLPYKVFQLITKNLTNKGSGKPPGAFSFILPLNQSPLICYYKYMTTINPWINFNGNTEEAFTFYKSVFGGEFTKIVRFKDLASDDFKAPESEENKIMYISLPIGNGSILTGNDVPEFMGRVSENENRSKILINTENKEDADRIFNELSVDGSVEGPIGDSPWGTYAGMFRDRYGIEWIVEFNPGK
jgi:PhnB protein